MTLPAPILHQWSDIQLNFDAILKSILGTWRPIMLVSGHGTTFGNTTFVFTENNGLQTYGGGAALSPRFLRLDAASLRVPGKKTKLRLACGVLVNNVAPGITFTFSMRQVTASAGGAGAISYTVGGGWFLPAIVTPPALTVTSTVSGEIDLPADGIYTLAVAGNGTAAANSLTSCWAQLELRHV